MLEILQYQLKQLCLIHQLNTISPPSLSRPQFDSFCYIVTNDPQFEKKTRQFEFMGFFVQCFIPNQKRSKLCWLCDEGDHLRPGNLHHLWDMWKAPHLSSLPNVQHGLSCNLGCFRMLFTQGWCSFFSCGAHSTNSSLNWTKSLITHPTSRSSLYCDSSFTVFGTFKWRANKQAFIHNKQNDGTGCQQPIPPCTIVPKLGWCIR